MKDHEHPCGALPVTGWNVSVYYCHHHQAYFASHSSYTQHGDEDMTQHWYGSIEFGPFDSSTDVLNWLGTFTPAIALLPTAVDESLPY